MPRTYTESGVEIIEYTGNIQQADAEELEMLLYSKYEQGCKNIIIDLREATQICSAALGLLVSFKQTFLEKNGDLKVVVESPQIQELLKVTMLDKIFDTSDVLADVVSSFQK